MPWTDDELVTERLRLHSWTEQDRANAERLLIDPGVRRFLGGPVGLDGIARRRLTPMGELWGSFCVWSSLPDGSIIAVTQAANTASRRVLQRLGFSEERTFTEWGAEQVQARLQRPIS
jgi:RimJ/RimL family protein N-acetyltransferase